MVRSDPPSSQRDAGGFVLPRRGGFADWAVAHPVRIDVLGALAVLLVDLLVSSTTYDPQGADRPWAIALPLVAAAVLVVRRRRPYLVAGVVLALDLGVTGSTAGHALLAVAVAVYTVAVERSAAAGWITAGVAVAATTIAASGWSVYVVELGVACLLAMVTGIWIATRRRYLEALVELANRLALERDQRGRLAVADERARIAREMHDIVGHGLTVMIRLADGAGGLVRLDPDRAAAATGMIADTGRSSLTELRRTLGVLRGAPDGREARDGSDGAPRPGGSSVADDAVALEPQPSIADLDLLVERFRGAGLPVAVERSGALDRLSEGAALVVYRAVQEALTNALRYAGAPSRVLVVLDADGPDVAVTVTDDGAGADPSTPSEGGGRGVVGLRERAAMFGGTVTAGPLPVRGWQVRMVLPGAGANGGTEGERG